MSVRCKPPGTLAHWSQHPTCADPGGCCRRCSRSCSPQAPRENAVPTADGEWSTRSRLQVGAQADGVWGALVEGTSVPGSEPLWAASLRML